MKTIDNLKPQVKKALPELQNLVNELKRLPALSEYITQHNLKSISDEYQLIDELLDNNILI